MKLLTFISSLLMLAVSKSEILTLTDETFEHQTQASTGQTTGKWLVMLGAVWCGYSCNKLHPALQQISETVDGVLTAKVDTTSNKQLAKRFDVKKHPTLILFADRLLYPYEGEQTVEAMKEFVSGGYKNAKGLSVPAPPSFIEKTMDDFHAFLESNKEIQYLKDDFNHILEIRKNAAIAILAIGLVVGFCLGGIMCRGGSTSKKSKME